jgi:hypothetical protein
MLRQQYSGGEVFLFESLTIMVGISYGHKLAVNPRITPLPFSLSCSLSLPLDYRITSGVLQLDLFSFAIFQYHDFKEIW